MRKASLAKNHTEFEEDMVWYREFLERIIAARVVIRKKDDKIEVVESSILRICATWEAFVEGELIDCLNLDCTKCAGYLGLKLPPHMDRDLCEAVLLGTQYLDFRKVGDIKGFAKNILTPAANPFRFIDNTTARKIDEVYAIRNYLSHYSSRSQRTLNRMYKDRHGLRQFLAPGRFLLAYDARRLFEYIDAFLAASTQMRGLP